VVLALLAVACGGAPQQAAQPTPLPTVTPRPAVPPTAVAPTPAPLATLDPRGGTPSEVEGAFLDNIDELIGEIADLTATPCEDLRAIATQNPNLLPSLRGFVSTIRRLGGSQAALDTDSVKAALGDLDQSVGQLEGALNRCGLAPT